MESIGQEWIRHFIRLKVLNGNLGRVRKQLAVIPGAPIIVSDLGGQTAAASQLRIAAMTAVGWLISDVVNESVSEDEKSLALVYLPREADYTALAGSLLPWGSAAEVGKGHYLPELIARWVLREVSNSVLVDATFTSVKAALESRYHRILIVADGPSGLSENSPIGFKAGAHALDALCREAFAPMAGENKSSLAADSQTPLVAAECGWRDFNLWRELRALEASESKMLYSAAPFGVGYHVDTIIVSNADTDLT